MTRALASASLVLFLGMLAAGIFPVAAHSEQAKPPKPPKTTAKSHKHTAQPRTSYRRPRGTTYSRFATGRSRPTHRITTRRMWMSPWHARSFNNFNHAWRFNQSLARQHHQHFIGAVGNSWVVHYRSPHWITTRAPH